MEINPIGSESVKRRFSFIPRSPKMVFENVITMPGKTGLKLVFAVDKPQAFLPRKGLDDDSGVKPVLMVPVSWPTEIVEDKEKRKSGWVGVLMHVCI